MLGDLLAIYMQLHTFGAQLKFSEFSLSHFMCALVCPRENKLLSAIHMGLLREIKRPELAPEVEAKHTSRFDHHLLCWLSLDVVVWPELVRRYAEQQLNGFARDECQWQCAIRVERWMQQEYWTLPVCAKVEILRFLCESALITEQCVAMIEAGQETTHRVMRPLGYDKSDQRYWLVGGHVFKESLVSGVFGTCSNAELGQWKRQRGGGSHRERALAKRIRAVEQRVHATRLPQSLLKAFIPASSDLAPESQSVPTNFDFETATSPAGETVQTLKVIAPVQPAVSGALGSVPRNAPPSPSDVQCLACKQSAWGHARVAHTCSRASREFHKKSLREGAPAPKTEEGLLYIIRGAEFNPNGYSNNLEGGNDDGRDFYGLNTPALYSRFNLQALISVKSNHLKADCVRMDPNSTLQHARAKLLGLEDLVAPQQKSAPWETLRTKWSDSVLTATTGPQLARLLLEFETHLHDDALNSSWHTVGGFVKENLLSAGALHTNSALAAVYLPLQNPDLEAFVERHKAAYNAKKMAKKLAKSHKAGVGRGGGRGGRGGRAAGRGRGSGRGAAKSKSSPHYYIGRTVKDFFDGHGVFVGKVMSVDANEDPWLFKIKFEDGDVQEYDLHELRKIVQPEKKSKPGRNGVAEGSELQSSSPPIQKFTTTKSGRRSIIRNEVVTGSNSSRGVEEEKKSTAAAAEKEQKFYCPVYGCTGSGHRLEGLSHHCSIWGCPAATLLDLAQVDAGLLSATSKQPAGLQQQRMLRWGRTSAAAAPQDVLDMVDLLCQSVVQGAGNTRKAQQAYSSPSAYSKLLTEWIGSKPPALVDPDGATERRSKYDSCIFCLRKFSSTHATLSHLRRNAECRAKRQGCPAEECVAASTLGDLKLAAGQRLMSTAPWAAEIDINVLSIVNVMINSVAYGSAVGEVDGEDDSRVLIRSQELYAATSDLVDTTNATSIGQLQDRNRHLKDSVPTGSNASSREWLIQQNTAVQQQAKCPTVTNSRAPGVKKVDKKGARASRKSWKAFAPKDGYGKYEDVVVQARVREQSHNWIEEYNKAGTGRGGKTRLSMLCGVTPVFFTQFMNQRLYKNQTVSFAMVAAYLDRYLDESGFNRPPTPEEIKAARVRAWNRLQTSNDAEALESAKAGNSTDQPRRKMTELEKLQGGSNGMRVDSQHGRRSNGLATLRFTDPNPKLPTAVWTADVPVIVGSQVKAYMRGNWVLATVIECDETAGTLKLASVNELRIHAWLHLKSGKLLKSDEEEFAKKYKSGCSKVVATTEHKRWIRRAAKRGGQCILPFLSLSDYEESVPIDTLLAPIRLFRKRSGKVMVAGILHQLKMVKKKNLSAGTEDIPHKMQIVEQAVQQQQRRRSGRARCPPKLKDVADPREREDSSHGVMAAGASTGQRPQYGWGGQAGNASSREPRNIFKARRARDMKWKADHTGWIVHRQSIKGAADRETFDSLPKTSVKKLARNGGTKMASSLKYGEEDDPSLPMLKLCLAWRAQVVAAATLPAVIIQCGILQSCLSDSVVKLGKQAKREAMSRQRRLDQSE
jgi:hypothetical protein